jgi:uncharacterized protein YbjT (DUF2867 family)
MTRHVILVRPLFTFLIRCSVVAVAAIAPAVAVEPITEKPWREAVLSVTDLDITARFFTEIGGYETLDRGALSASAIAAWGLPAAASGNYRLLRAPMGGDFGQIRLVTFEGAGAARADAARVSRLGYGLLFQHDDPGEEYAVDLR